MGWKRCLCLLQMLWTNFLSHTLKITNNRFFLSTWYDRYLNSNLLGNVEIFWSSVRRLLSELMSATGLERAQQNSFATSLQLGERICFIFCGFLPFMNVFGSCRTLVYIHKMKRWMCFAIPCNVDLKYLNLLHSFLYVWTISARLQMYANEIDCTVLSKSE